MSYMIISQQWRKNKMNVIKLTDGQLEYLQELVMFGYEMEVPEQKGWDVQTYDNLVDAVMI